MKKIKLRLPKDTRNAPTSEFEMVILSLAQVMIDISNRKGKMSFKIRAFLMILLCSSCSFAVLKPYESRLKNINHASSIRGFYFIRSIKGVDKRLNDRINSVSVWCRTSSIDMPKGKTIGAFITDAMSDDLKYSKKLDKNGTPIDIIIHELDSSAFNSNAYWVTDFEYIVGTRPIKIRNKFDFEGAFGGLSACNSVKDHFPLALGENFSELYKHLK